MSIRVKITLDPVTKDIEPATYQEAWEEHCDDQGDVEEGDEYPPITTEFVVEQFQEAVENGNVDLAEVFESASVDVQAI